MTIQLRLPMPHAKVLGVEWFSLSATARTSEVQTMGDALPCIVMAGPPEFELRVVGFEAALAAVNAINPAITRAELQRLIREQTDEVGQHMTGGSGRG